MLDELLDRLWDGVILASIAWVARDGGTADRGVAALAALCASFLSSYVRARGASLGYSVEESHVTRGLRYALVVAGLAFGWLGWTLWAAAGDLRCWPSLVRTSAGRQGGARVTTSRETIATLDAGAMRRRACNAAFVLAYRSACAARAPAREGSGRRLFRRLGRLALPTARPGARSVVAAQPGPGAGPAADDPLVRRVDARGVRALRAVLVRLVPLS